MANIDKDTQDMIAALDRLGVKVDDPVSDEHATGNPSIASSLSQTRSVGPHGSYHELHFEYPAMNLLPKKATPYLSRPKNLQYREAPRAGAFHQDTDNLSFSVQLQTLSTVADSHEPIFEPCTSFIEAAQRLYFAPGVSNLELVAYYENEDIKYRARIRIRWITARGTSVESHTFNCTAAEWFDLLRDNQDDPATEWLYLLQDLTDRASDRAYLHVRQRLFAHNPDLSLAHDEQFADDWNTINLLSPNQLLHDRIIWRLGRGAELPCGCFNPGISEFYIINAMSESEAVEFQCHGCHKPVLTDQDMSHIAQRHDRRLRLKAKIAAQCWTLIPAQIRASWPNNNKPFEISHAKIRETIQEILETLEVPESVVPAELCLTGTRETAIVTMRFFELFHQDEQRFSMIPEQMIELLVEAAQNKLRIEAGLDEDDDLTSVMPIGYAAFLQRWFERAVAKLEYYRERDVETLDRDAADELMGLMMGERRFAGKGGKI
ncbi:unnamed protein product [Zymoseptoria tritici ST99CH_1E4]|uniref:Uncharacterized protein n=1 Tax=Zymoseptoria tritici ST99CH_1E4 TaxID=1276532 RepID=A0A2H1FWM9_ZYMTR|nr:unnamed protein product [Zymoseptoria tritici ST99CH_1E4]